MKNLIKKEFKEKVQVIDYLISEYKNELQKTFKSYDELHRATRKNRLKRIRLELDEILKDIENNYRDSWYFNEVVE